MIYCPKCHANVEGLVYRCDCCGALLDKSKKRFFKCGIYELPQCLEFSSLIYEMIDALQSIDSEKYGKFLENVSISMICYPEWMLEEGKINEKIIFFPKKRYASLTIVVDFKQFVAADHEHKADLIAKTLLQNIKKLQKRLMKYGFSIESAVEQAGLLLSQYMVDSLEGMNQ